MMISGKAAEYKLFWKGNEKVFGFKFLLFKCSRARDINRVIDKVLFQGIIISVISIYAPQCGLDDSQKIYFYDSLINVVGKLEEKLMFTLEVTQKTMRNSKQVLVMELGTSK